MGKPAARVGDMHTCPLSNEATSHADGPIMPPGEATVLIAGFPAARVGDSAACSGSTDSIIQGSATVFIGGQPAARTGDVTAHGGHIAAGAPTVLIGD